jgi:hypothetical protein
MKPIWLALLVCSCAALAQDGAPSFPDDSVAPSSAEIAQRLAGKVMAVKLANGGSWRLEYKANGYFFINTNTGFSDTGEWKAEDGKLCSKGRKIRESCNEVRIKGDAFFLKRDSGEIVQFVVQ